MKTSRIILISGLVASAFSLSACMPNYSEGTRSGVITKLSYKGVYFKSWEGSINQGGTRSVSDSNGNSSVVANTTDFNVQDPEIVKKLQAAMESGGHVTIEYRQWLLAPPSIDNDRVVVGVK